MNDKYIIYITDACTNIAYMMNWLLTLLLALFYIKSFFVIFELNIIIVGLYVPITACCCFILDYNYDYKLITFKICLGDKKIF